MRAWGDMPVGLDYAETSMFHALQAEGLNVVDGQQIMLAARRDQELGRDPAAHAGGRHGRWRLPHDLRGAETRHPRERHRRECRTRCSTRWAATTSRRSKPSRASAAIRTRTTSPTAISAPATRRSSTSCSPIRGLPDLLLPHLQHRAATPAQTDAYVKAREWIDASIEMNQAGRQHRQGGGGPGPGPRGVRFSERGRGLWPAVRARAGIGACTSARSSAARCRFDHPMEIQDRQWSSRWRPIAPAADGYSAARIEEEVVVTRNRGRGDQPVPGGELPIATGTRSPVPG